MHMLKIKYVNCIQCTGRLREAVRYLYTDDTVYRRNPAVQIKHKGS